MRTASANQRADYQYGRRPRDSQNFQKGLSPSTRRDGAQDNATECAQEASRLLDNLPAHDVLFYPIAGLDLEPLRRVGHLADVFLFADWRYEPSGFDATIDELADIASHDGGLELFSQDADQRSYEVPAEHVRALTGVSDDFALFHEPAWVPGKQPWCRIVRLKRRGGKVERPVWLVYVVGNCIDIYQHLFVDRSAAPRMLWLDPPLGADLDRWAEFISPGGDFGHVFTSAARQPHYVAAQSYQPGWPQSVLCQRLPAWHPAWDLNLLALPDLPMRAYQGR